MERILITGASKGIGRAIAVALAGPNKQMLLHGRDEDALAETAALVKKAGASTQIITAELADTHEIERMIQEIGDKPLNVLVNNAGLGYVNPLDKLDIEEWDVMIAVNVTAPYLLCKGLVPHMKPGASIVNILSGAAKVGFPGWSSYCMTKFALNGFAQALREELRGDGIRVINIYPGATDTDIWDQVPGDWPRDEMLRPEDTARAVKTALEMPPTTLVEDITLGRLGGAL